jgi:hypothetical protein
MGRHQYDLHTLFLCLQIARFLRAPGKPVILAMCRPDPKKNVLGLLRAYGQSRVLKDLANLVLILVSEGVTGERQQVFFQRPSTQLS